MDVSKYMGAAFLKLGDVKVNGPLRLIITDVEEGKYDRPDVSFDDGTRLGLNVTGTRNLARAWGVDTDAWLGKEVELSVGETDINGKTEEMIVVTPISPPIPREDRPPPPKPSKRNKDAGDLNDEIPF